MWCNQREKEMIKKMVIRLKQLLFLWRRVKDVYIYEFPMNKKGERQIWTPYVVKDKQYFVDYINTFYYVQSLNHAVYGEVLPDVVIGFINSNEKMKSVIDEMEEDEKNGFLEEVFTVFSGLNVIFPITKLNSSEFSGIMPDGRFKSNVAVFEANEVVESRFKTNCGDDCFGEEQSFFSFDCPFCGVPYNFKSPEEIPEKDMCCGNCDNVLIQYTGKEMSYSLGYTLDKESIEYLEKLKLKKPKAEEVKK